MTTSPPASVDSAFQRPHTATTKLIGFSELVRSFRSILQSSDKNPSILSATDPEGAAAHFGPTVRERPLLGDQESSGPNVDPLELLLAGAGPPIRSLPVEGHLPDPLGKVVTAGANVETPVIEHVVRRLFIGGDRRRGVARIDLDGDYAGTTLWVRGEDGAIELEVVLGPGLSADGLPERLLGRLRASGLEVSSLEVR